MWGAIRARLVGSKASSKRLVCAPGWSHDLRPGASVLFWSIGEDSTVSRFLHEKKSLDRRSGGPVNLLRPEFWEHLIAALFSVDMIEPSAAGRAGLFVLSGLFFFVL